MNKLFRRIATLSVGLAMAIGVGVAVDAKHNGVNKVEAADSTYTLGTIPTKGWKTSGGSQTMNGISWTYDSTTSISGNNNKIQVGSQKNPQTSAWHIKTAISNFGSGKIVKSIIFSAYTTATSATYSISVGGSSVKSGSLTTSTADYSVSNLSASTGNVDFAITGSSTSKAMYITGISITYGDPETQTCTVTLNKNGGSGGTDSVTATKGSAMPTLASAPTMTGYAFAGYYDDASAGTQYYTAGRASARNWDKDGTAATLYAHWTANQYNINYYDQGGSDFSGVHVSGYPTKHTYGTETTLKGATRGGYNFDGWFTTSACTGSAVTTLGATSYTDAINLYAKWTATGIVYPINTTVSGGTYSGDTSITDNGGVASVTIAATGDHKLPAAAVVEETTYITVVGASFTYDSSTGTISLSSAVGPDEVTISVICPDLDTFSITVNESNGSHTGDSTIKEKRTATLTFVPTTGWGQPADVTVSGATKSWNRTSGVLTLSNPTGNVTVTYAAVGNELTSITLGTQKTAYILGEDFSMPVVTAHYSVAADKVVTGSATESGYDPYSLGDQSITISYTEGGITKTSSYSVTVSAKSVQTITTWTRVTSINDLTAGTYIIGYEATAGSGTIVPLRSDGANATTSANGYFYTGTTADSSNSNTISIATNMSSTGYEFTVEKISSNVINIKNAAGNYLGATSGGTTSNKGRLYTSGNSNETNFTVAYSGDKFSMTAAVSGSYKYLKYNSGSPRYAVYNSSANDTSFYKKGTESTGSASLIRIVCNPAIDPATGYKGGDKFVGDKVYTTDFVVKKQYDTGTTLEAVTGFTINGGEEVELTSTSNTITVSYTEGGIPKSTEVVVAATERVAELESIQLVEKGLVKKSGYIDFASATWNLDNIYVHYYWSDDEFDTEVTLASLVATDEASISPIKPTVGATSFTISYEYLEVQITNNTVTLTEAVRSDYVTSMYWGNTTAAHFKHFSGEQLTEAIVNTWHVKATYAGAGEGSRLYWGDYDLYVGSKQITSLPYTWLSEDDGQALSIHYGEDVDGNEFVKTNDTAVGNICATINPIDHDEETTGEQTITLNLVGASYTKEGTSGTGSDTEVTISGFTISSNKGYAASESMRVYDGGSFTITSSYEMTNVSVTTTGGKNGLSGGSASGTSYEETADGQARVTTVTITYNGTVKTTTHYANDMDHFDAQKKVVEFAKFMNTTMNGSNVCSGTFEYLASAWKTVGDKYDALFGEGTTLDATELAWAKNMLKYANATWGSDAEIACVEKAMKTYEFCIAKHSLTPFMFEEDGVTPLRSINLSEGLKLFSIQNSSTILIVSVVSLISVAAAGGYFFLRKKKED